MLIPSNRNIEFYSIMKNSLPIFEWLPKYNLKVALPDFISGITVGLTLIPQALAYATLAGLTPVHGLYSSLVGGFIYTILGTVPEFTIGPTSIMCLITYPHISKASYGAVEAAILLCFLSGIIELLIGLLQLGVLVNFVSTPVMTGFASAGAIIIASSQIRDLIGMKNTAEPFLVVWRKIYENIEEVRYQDASLGISCCIVLLTLRFIRIYGVALTEETEQPRSKIRLLIWFISISRNAVVVITTTIIAYNLHDNDENPFTLTTDVPPGLPPFQLPKFKVENGNQTVTFTEMVSEVGSGLFLVPLFAILANIATAKPFSQGKSIRVKQEIIAVGACNLIGAFFGSMPVHAAFSRAAISNTSGAKTPFTGLYSGILIILSLTFMTPYFHYIPKATLAAVVICAIIFIVDVSVIKPMWKINKADWIPYWTTVFVCLLIGIEYGLIVGIIAHLLVLLYYNARPSLQIEAVTQDDVEYIKITPSSALLFPSAEYLRNAIAQLNVKNENIYNIIVINCFKVNRTDFTTFKCITALVNDLNKFGRKLLLINIEETLIFKGLANCPVVENEEKIRDFIHNMNKLEIISK